MIEIPSIPQAKIRKKQNKKKKKKNQLTRSLTQHMKGARSIEFEEGAWVRAREDDWLGGVVG